MTGELVKPFELSKRAEVCPLKRCTVPALVLAQTFPSVSTHTDNTELSASPLAVVN